MAFYPAGRLPARWWRWPVAAVVAGLTVITVGSSLDPEAYDDIVTTGPAPVTLPAHALVTAGGLAALALVLAGTAVIWGATGVRLVRSRPPERQQLAWLVCVVPPLVVCTFFLDAPPPVTAFFAFLLPVSIAIGVARYRLLGIVVSRGLVYAALTGAVVLGYLVVAAVAGAALGRTLSPLSGTVAAALVAVALGPARSRLQVAAVDEAELLPAVLATLTSALRSPGATVTGPDGRCTAAAGTTEGDTVEVALRVAGRDVGTLAVALRAPGEAFTPGDERLLAVLAPQVAVVVRALDLAGSLERERDRVLGATAAERDRIRRDLHDGLGPSLAGIGLGVQAVAAQLRGHGDPASGALLDRLEEGVDAAVGEVRRIIDGLRPALLDEVGIVTAIERHAQAVSVSVPVRVVAGALPPLPPDVEATAYRIAQEALTNVARHSGARSAEVGLRARDGRLEVEVVDDGAGFAADDRAGTSPGVGLGSMRTRARSLGGELLVSSGADGTRVLAALPLEVA